jgi:hypothetical protein
MGMSQKAGGAMRRPLCFDAHWLAVYCPVDVYDEAIATAITFRP